MILPIRAYGDPILREKARRVENDSPAIQRLIDDMLDTMVGADGMGLAAPQVGHALRLFVADLDAATESLPPVMRDAVRATLPPQPMVCINPETVEESEVLERFEEACLSIPKVPEWVDRPREVTLRYLDRTFEEQTVTGVGPIASLLQHERDHLDGILHIDYLSSFRKRLIRRRLRRIANGTFRVDYPMHQGH